MHAVFVSPGIVLNKKGIGEANALVSVLTEEFGLIRASARSTRTEVSKLRYGLEPLTEARFSFVRGRHEWKLTDVEAVSRTLVPRETQMRLAAGRIAKLLLRLIHGEDERSALYQTVSQGLRLLARSESVQEAQAIECILVLRALSHLGYLPQTPALAPFIEGDFASAELAMSAQASRSLLIRAINESLSQTGL